MSDPDNSKFRTEPTCDRDDQSGSQSRVTSTRSKSLQARSLRVEDLIVDDVIIVPTRQATPSISLSGFLLLVASFFLFKGVCIAWIGAAEYAASIAYLQSSSLFEQAAAFIMVPDVVSEFVARQIVLMFS